MLRLLATLALALLLAGCASNEPVDDDAAAAELYESATAAIERGDWTTATQELEALQAQYPFGAYATQAQLDIIYVYYRAGETESAVAAAERFRRINPRHPAVPYSWYMEGVAQQEAGQDTLTRWFGIERSARDPVPLERAYQALRTLVERFPDSDYRSDAEARMAVIFDQLASYELSVAEFYAARQAWVAAARRSIHVLDNYPRTVAIPGALDVLETAYRALELQDLAASVARVRQLDLPTSGRFEAPARDGIPELPDPPESDDGESVPLPGQDQPQPAPPAPRPPGPGGPSPIPGPGPGV
ncbi:outer membrane protein assembly factor BamD [Sediminicurvatus halobius]|uniref:Outer membrane protein assembly factor BamD n=1 Tax=Sediminicurvatus halobius TaxID=2182432 RepID=A0A2U2N045_9GAMM|nr:outer membrane protein assembly factor BamD [Spiribacter halobius]PWG62621.1 outer membrane protein assembly factor BamD [Spiribacter halobius]UEX78460.1 outer membrane protein assembly factor BamD [Spiribacter halobius]